MKRKNDPKQIISEIVLKIDENIHLFKDPSVESGTMGLAIFYSYCYEMYGHEDYLFKTQQLIETSISYLSKISEQAFFLPKYRGDSISNVISSFGKGLMFIEYKFSYEYNFEEYYNSIDEILIELTLKNNQKKDFDFFSGALSSGHYFINRFHFSNDMKYKNILLKIYEAIVDGSIYDNVNEVHWEAPTYSNQVYLGISHGSAMIINFITKLFKVGIFNVDNTEKIEFLQKSVNFVMAKKRDLVSGYFPNVVKETVDNEPTVYTLCYGDLGVLYALTSTTSLLLNSSHIKEINSMMLTCSQRKKNANQTSDGGIFYGASGVYCVYRALYQNLKDNIFKVASEYWYNQILNYRMREIHYQAGYAFLSNHNQIKSLRYSFGWGLSGVGICLMLGINEELPLLDDILLIGI